MKKPKILFLLMSADIPFFKEQIEDCKRTWLSVLENGNQYNEIVTKYADVTGWKYYDVSFNKKCCLVREQNGQNSIALNADAVVVDESDEHHLQNVLLDDGWTFQKTYDALKYEAENSEWDYVVRTNTSTYVNIPLLCYLLYKEFNNENTDSANTAYGTDLMSIHSLACPSAGDIYIRGNCLILSRHQVENVVLKYGQLFSPGMCVQTDNNLIDDICIGNLLNCYYNNFIKEKETADGVKVRNLDYTRHIRCFPQMWYKCTEVPCNFNHTWSVDGFYQDFKENDDECAARYSCAAAVQVRSYYTDSGRAKTEHEHYFELHEKMSRIVYAKYGDENILLSIYNKIKEYQKNPDVWVQGNLPYMKQGILLSVLSDKELFNRFSSYCMSATPIDHQLWKYKERIMKENNVDFFLKRIEDIETDDVETE